ncbi:MAG TPA: ORF6N domain-containing protein [Vicinamibacterales bacterium]|nr:ORF6N domain-containing protein [Vicinamibacterales bacterium]
MASTRRPVPSRVQRQIVEIRRRRVLVDADLAGIYDVSTKHLNQAVGRNRDRFPADFAFRLTTAEWSRLKSHFVTSNHGRGGRRNTPLVFTEHGAIMAAAVLNSAQAVEMSVFVVRAFIRFRQLSLVHADLASKLRRLEERVTVHDGELKQVIGALRSMLSPLPRPRRRIGFGV